MGSLRLGLRGALELGASLSAPQTDNLIICPSVSAVITIEEMRL